MIDPLRAAIVVAAFAVPTATTYSWVGSASERLERAQTDSATADNTEQIAVAAAADEGYCTGDLKKILRRVLYSCGLLGAEQGGVRGCQPLEAKNVATMSGDDFNALFKPMKQRGGIIQFEVGKSELDDAAAVLIDGIFSDQRGASYFFVVSRASASPTSVSITLTPAFARWSMAS